MRFLWIILPLFSFACENDANKPTDDELCTDTTGIVEGAVVVDYNWSENEPSPAPNARVQATCQDGESLTIATDAEGLFSVSLMPGTWTFSAQNSFGDCFSLDDVSVEVEACETSAATVRINECYG